MPDSLTATLKAYANSAAEREGVPPGILSNLISAESSWNVNAVGPATKSGEHAMGIAQILPSAHPGVDYSDPFVSIDFAASYLRQNFDLFGNWPQAVAAYNAGPGRVANGIPSYTQSYVNKVMGGSGTTSSPSSSSPGGSGASQVGTKIGYGVALVMLALAAGELSRAGAFHA